KRFVELSEVCLDVRHERADTRAPTVVVQPLGETLGFAQALQRPPGLTELVQHRPQLHANLEGLLQQGWGLGKRVDECQRLLEPVSGFFETGANVDELPSLELAKLCAHRLRAVPDRLQQLDGRLPAENRRGL